ncbi:MAG: TIGR02099 family protein [Zoogloeaceae bacterium]|jgi:uncharacterized protein (TIGR02099 family)|nr:TIGR02099 family protein [Zoogloeaceae bacterium]
MSYADGQKNPRFGRWRRGFLYCVVFAFCLILGAGFLAARFWVSSALPQYLPNLEAALGEALEQPVKIHAIQLNWRGLNPEIVLENVRVLADESAGFSGDAVTVERVRALFSWRSLADRALVFSRLTLDRPRLAASRGADGQWRVRGLRERAAEREDAPVLRWFLMQRYVRVRNAEWKIEDESAALPPLLFSGGMLDWRNHGARRRFGLVARGESDPGKAALFLDLRGDMTGEADRSPLEWQGNVYARAEAERLAVWQQWLPRVFFRDGAPDVQEERKPFSLDAQRGAIRFWLARDAGNWQATADFFLSSPAARLAAHLPELLFVDAGGRLELSRKSSGEWLAQSRRLQWTEKAAALAGAEPVARMTPMNISVRWQEMETEKGGNAKEESSSRALLLPRTFSARANALDLTALRRISAHLPFSAFARERLDAIRPRGMLRDVVLEWREKGAENEAGAAPSYALNAKFSDLGVAAYDNLPGAENLSGELRVTEAGGELTLQSRVAAVSLPAVFTEPRFPLDRLDAEIHWRALEKNDRVAVEIRRLAFSGPHLAGDVRGRYESRPESAGQIDLRGNFSRVRAAEVWRYIPKVCGAYVAPWLRRALLEGESEADLVLRGNLDHFPFPDVPEGASDNEGADIFRISARARGVRLRYNPNWPDIEGIAANMEFGAGMKLAVRAARIFSARIHDDTRVIIPDFSDPEPRLLVTGNASGDTAEFLRFIEKSPVSGMIHHFTSDMESTGTGSLALALDVPLHRTEDSTLTGAYRMKDNTLRFLPGVPAARAVQGTLLFTEGRLDVPEMTGEFLGRPARLGARTEKDAVRINIAGNLSAKAVKEASETAASGDVSLPPVLREAIFGETNWRAEITVRGAQTSLSLSSDLEGLALRVPPPFAKAAAEKWPFVFRAQFQPQSASRIAFTVGASANPRASAQLFRRKGKFERGAIALGRPLRVPDKGVALLVRQGKLDADLWREWLGEAASGEKGKAAAVSGVEASSPPLDMFTLIQLDAQEFSIFGETLREAGLRFTPRGENGQNGWRLMVAAQEALGEISLEKSANAAGREILNVDLRRLRLSDRSASVKGGAEKENVEKTAQKTDAVKSFPALKARIGDLFFGARRLGQLTLRAENVEERGVKLWRLSEIALENPDGKLSGRGVWRPLPESQTRLDLSLLTADSGKLLGRLGYPDMLRGGAAELSGEISWRGGPLDFDLKALRGRLGLTASNGQFSRVDPGAGKLLGLLSLQSISRRLSLDFRDIFSNGYAYDSLTARVSLADGILTTDKDMKIVGPAGTVLMNGSVDLRRETQNLELTIQPELGGIAAVGAAAVIHPLAGAAALLAQQALKNPLNRMLRLQYQVTGSWSNPEVKHKGAEPVSLTPERSAEEAAPISDSLPAP